MNGTLKIPQPTWFVGCGNMGRAILDGWRMGGLDLSSVTVDPSEWANNRGRRGGHLA